MPFVPNEAAAATYPRQAALAAADLDEIIGTFLNNAVVEGCAITAGTGLSVSMAAGTRLAAGRFAVVAAAANQALGTADATYPRIDTIVLNSAGTFTIRAGTPGTALAAPVPPDYTAGDIVLAMVYVPAAATTLTSTNIVDKRIIRDPRGTIYADGGQTNVTAIVTNQNLWTGVTIPATYLKVGDRIHIEAWLVETTSTTPGNLTLRVKLGSTILATTGASARVASLTTRPVKLECDILVISTTTLEVQGMVTYPSSATAANLWSLGSAINVQNVAVVTIGTTAQVLTIDVTTTVATATLRPRLITVDMF